jgi:hypothetical protein
MRKFRGIPQTLKTRVPAAQPECPGEAAPPQDGDDVPQSSYRLKPLYSKEERGIVLFDIYRGTEWLGSRRTREQCITFLSERRTMEAQAGIEPASPDLQSVA